MKGYTLPCTLSLVFVMSITVEGCQETGEIKVNSNDKYIIVCVWICNISLISWWRFSHPGNINQVLYQIHPLFSMHQELNGRSVDLHSYMVKFFTEDVYIFYSYSKKKIKIIFIPPPASFKSLKVLIWGEEFPNLVGRLSSDFR